MKLKVLAGAVVSQLLVVTSAQAVPTTYYDIDFSAPINTVGSTPATGSGTDTVSSVVFGQPVVESSFGALADESLVFNTTGNTGGCCHYDQIKLDLGESSDRYQVSFDLSTENYVNTGAGNTFTLLFDTPQVRNIYFQNDGTIREYARVLGSFSDNSLLNMMIDINLATNTWDVFMNGGLLSTSVFTPSGDDIESLRFSFGGSSTTSFDSVGIDNIKVTNGEVLASVPEPAALSLMLLGLIGVGFNRRKYAA